MSARITQYALIAASVVVAVVVGVSLRVIDSPSEAREKRLDARRVDALNAVSHAVDVYFGRQGRLPADLSDLRDVSSAETRDPATGEPFAYSIKGAQAYELCAVFAHDSPHYERNAFWWHAAGRQCYKLTVRETRH